MGKKKGERRHEEVESDEKMTRSIVFPKSLWKAIDAEAKLKKRSAVRQLEYLLSVYYGLIEPVEEVPLADRVNPPQEVKPAGRDSQPGDKPRALPITSLISSHNTSGEAIADAEPGAGEHVPKRKGRKG